MTVPVFDTCESCGIPAEVRLEDGSTWCICCDIAAREQGLDNEPAELLAVEW